MVAGLNGLGRVAKVGVTLRWRKPAKTIENPKTWGECLRKRRLELGLTSAEAARMLGIMPSTLYVWECGKKKPHPTSCLKIMDFLGHIPSFYARETLGQRMAIYRLLHGLSKRKFANLLGVAAETLRKWERGESEPEAEKMEKVEKLLTETPSLR